MAGVSIPYDISVLLSEVKALKEFELDTPVNKGVLTNIDLLLSLPEEKKINLDRFFDIIKCKVSTTCRSSAIIYLQVKSLVQPSVLPRFHQGLHSFRAYELPKLLLEQSHSNLLPDSSCEDLILWQCILDITVKKELEGSMK